MRYSVADDNIKITHRGCTIVLPDPPHPSMQRWTMKYGGIETTGKTEDTTLHNIPNILFSERISESEVVKCLDEFIDKQINKFPYK